MRVVVAARSSYGTPGECDRVQVQFSSRTWCWSGLVHLKLTSCTVYSIVSSVEINIKYGVIAIRVKNRLWAPIIVKRCGPVM